MMNRQFCLFAVLVLFPLLLNAQQFDTTSYQIKFFAENEGMWNAGPTELLPSIAKDYTFSWNESVTIGGIESVLGMDFGAKLYGRTAGKIGVGYYMSNINGGMIDSIIYPINIDFIVPRAEDIRAGQTIRIASTVKVDENRKPSIETTFPLEGKAGVKMVFDLETDLDLSVCAFDACLNINPERIHSCVSDIMDFEFNRPILEINTYNSEPRMTVPDLVDLPCVPNLGFNIPCIGRYNLIPDFNYWPSTQEISFFPVEFGLNRTLKSKHPLSKYAQCIADTTNSLEDCVTIGNLSRTIRGTEKLDDFLVGYFSLPFIDTLYTTTTRNRLLSRGADTAVSMEFRPLNLVAGGKFHDGRFEFPIPCSGGSFYASYMLIRPTLNLDVLLKQDMTFDAQVIVSLELPAELAYRVKNKAGRVIQSGNDRVITYEVGNDLFVDFPCTYEYIDFKPTFKVKNKLTNRTYASLNMDGQLQALEVGIGMDEITVVPEIELCIPNPFGDDWCTTIRAVTFGFNASKGPLINEKISNYMANPEDMNIEIDIFNDSWEIKSFKEIKTPAFRVAPTRFTVNVAPDTILCYGSADGSLLASVHGGTPPYSYGWSDNNTTREATQLTAGDYYVKVTDKNGCTAFNGTKIFEYPGLEISEIRTTDPECYGDATGSISITVTGGNPPYSYTWSDGSSAPALTNVGAGDYSVQVTDRNGCSVQHDFTLTHPAELTAYVNHKTDVLCNGENTGSLRINARGGVPGYDYHWSNGAISKDLDSLVAGLYTVKVVDRNNCSVTISETINEPTLLDLAIEVEKPISCYKGDDGTLFANISGGVQPYAITWYDPQNTLNNRSPVLPDLAEGLYQVEVYDANLCYQIDTLYLNAPQEPFRSVLDETHLSCNGSEDGMFELSVSGGTPPFTFLWSDGSTGQNRNGLAAGQYKVIITDANECTTHNNMVLLEPNPISGVFTMTRVTCEGEADGTLEFFPKGGTPPYSSSWSNGMITEMATGLTAGFHSVTITDSKGCRETFEKEVLLDGTNCFDIPNAFSPNNDGYNDTWVIKYIDTLYPNHTVRVFSPQGNVLYDPGRGAYIPWDGMYKNAEVPSGTYFYVIDFGNGSEPVKGSLTIIR